MPVPCDGTRRRNDGRPRRKLGNGPSGAWRTLRHMPRRRQRKARKSTARSRCPEPWRPRQVGRWLRSPCPARCSAPSSSRPALAGTPSSSDCTRRRIDRRPRCTRRVVGGPCSCSFDETGNSAPSKGKTRAHCYPSQRPKHKRTDPCLRCPRDVGRCFRKMLQSFRSKLHLAGVGGKVAGYALAMKATTGGGSFSAHRPP